MHKHTSVNGGPQASGDDADNLRSSRGKAWSYFVFRQGVRLLVIKRKAGRRAFDGLRFAASEGGA